MANTTKEQPNNFSKNNNDAFQRLVESIDKLREEMVKTNKEKSIFSDKKEKKENKKDQNFAKKLYDDAYDSVSGISALLGGPLGWGMGKVFQHYGGGLKKKLFDNKNKDKDDNSITSAIGGKARVSSKSSAAEWNKLEKQAAPLNNMSKTVNKKLDTIIGLMGGKKKGKDKEEQSWFQKALDNFTGSILGGALGAVATAVGAATLKAASKALKAMGMKKTAAKLEAKAEKMKASKGTKETSKVSKTEGKPKKTTSTKKPSTRGKPKKAPKAKGGGKLGKVLGLGSLLLGGTALAGAYVDEDTNPELANALNIAGTAATGLYYYDAAKDAKTLSNIAKETKAIKSIQAANTAKNTMQAAKVASLPGRGAAAATGVGGLLSVGFTAMDIYDKQKQKEYYRSIGDEREARKLAHQQWIKGGTTAIGTGVGGALGAAGGAVAGGVGAVPGAIAGAGLGATVGDVAGDALSWLYGKAYDKYYNWKDKREAAKLKAEQEKQMLEMDQEIGRAKNLSVIQLSEQMNIVVELLSELAKNMSAATQSDLDRQYINMIMKYKVGSGGTTSNGGSYSPSLNSNVTNPAFDF